MKRLLFLAYHFPPQGGAGTQRAVKFARDLPSFGYEPVLVTGPGTDTGRWTPQDGSLAADLPAELEVHRVDADRLPRRRRRERTARWLGLPSPFADWWAPSAAATALAVAAERPVDAILATMSPYENGAIASALAQMLDVPWVADLRDPWALDEMRTYPTRVHRARDRKRMRAVLGTADSIIMNTPEAAARLVGAFPELAARGVVVIPNGWDRHDFVAAPPTTAPGGFRIVHTGSLHSATGRGPVRRILGGTRGVDVLPRSHVFLLRALELLRERSPAIAAEVEVHLAGVATPADRAIAQAPGVHVLGYLPHARSVDLLRSADLLFLPMHDLPPGVRATIVPGKTYEYLAAGRPILAALPDGDARDIMATVPGATVCRPRDVESMARTIAEEVQRRRREGRAPERFAPHLASYERTGLSHRLAAALDDTLGVPSAPARPKLKLVG